MKQFAAILMISCMIFGDTLDLNARGRGGGGRGGGGGRSYGGGGGRSYGGGGGRPSTPSYSRPSSRPSTRPSSPSTSRPSYGSRPSVGTGSRPSIGTGTRPSIGTGSRPSIQPQPGTRPSINPGTRPGQSPSTRPGSGSRPGVGERPSVGNRPGAGSLPGLGTRPATSNRPGAGSRPERPNVNDRQDRLQGRLDNRSDRADNRMENRNDRAENRRDQWDDWHDRHYNHHDHWHHGHWHGHWGPGSRWNYWWDNYPALTAFGVTTWAVNRVGWAFGYNDYSNPYASDGGGAYDYSEPLVMTPDEESLAGDPDDTSPAPGPPEEAMSTFEKAQQQFYDGDYPAALSSVEAALKEMPNDAVVHEFRALVLFALEKYTDAAATLHAVLSVGPGWDWTTMSSLYSKASVYTDQLRKLEDFCGNNTDDAAACFVLAYHYITCDHKEAATDQLKQLVELQPNDQLAADLLQQFDPEAKIPNQPEPTKPPETVAEVSKEELQGSWQAKRSSGEQFELSLDAKDKFTWKFTSANGKSQEVKGVYAIDKDGILALEMNDEGTLLAQLDVMDNKMDFYMLGDSQGAPPLKFAKQ